MNGHTDDSDTQPLPVIDPGAVSSPSKPPQGPESRPSMAPAPDSLPPPPPILASVAQPPPYRPVGPPPQVAHGIDDMAGGEPRVFLIEDGRRGLSGRRRWIKPAAAAAAATAVAVGLIVAFSGDSSEPEEHAGSQVAEGEGGDRDAAAQPSEPDSEATLTLLRAVPFGYPSGVCTPATPDDGRVIAEVVCGPYPGAGGPASARYQLVEAESALSALRQQAQNSVAVRLCPGRIQSPGPWRRGLAAPEAGIVFCGQRAAEPVMGWTDTERKVFVLITGAPDGATAEQLYTWWTSNS